jgi:hypothetical protein
MAGCLNQLRIDTGSVPGLGRVQFVRCGIADRDCPSFSRITGTPVLCAVRERRNSHQNSRLAWSFISISKSLSSHFLLGDLPSLNMFRIYLSHTL